MYTITFYSFKGGVGRTMALVNVGLELVRRGRRVLLVDFDLEAPGLTTYDALRQEDEHPGIVEYVSEYLRTGESPEVTRFIYSVDLAKVRSRRKLRHSQRLPGADQRESTGQLWVMPSGRGDAAYGAALAQINWASLYEANDGYLFMEDTKAQWKEFVKPDYVLIDSRTGHTDVGGICTRQLADAVVLLFTPNEQNRLGLRDICSAIRAEEKANGHPIAMHLVMSNVPRLDDEEGILRRHKRRFLETLGFPTLEGVIERYDSLMHLDQRVFALERPRSRLAKQYRRLTHRLIIQNPDDRDGALFRLDQLRQELGGPVGEAVSGRFGVFTRTRSILLAASPDEIISHRRRATHGGGLAVDGFKDTLQRITDSFSNDLEVLLKVAELHAAVSDFDLACAVLDQAVNLGKSPQALLQRSRVLFQLGRKDGAIKDLQALIRLDAVQEDLVIEAIRDLHRLDPSRLLHDVTPERLSGMSPGAKAQLASLLATPEDSFARAVKLLMDAAKGVGRESPTNWHVRQQLSIFLLYRGEWEEVLEVWRDQAMFFTRRYHAMALFHQALASWGIGGELPQQTCRRIAELTVLPSACRNYPPDCQALAMVHWRLGEPERAKEYLLLARRLIAKRVTPELSFWRCLEVTAEEFRDDCQQIAHLVDGEKLLPQVIAKHRKP